MKKILCVVFVLCFVSVFGSSESYVRDYSTYLMSGQHKKCHSLLVKWKREYPDQKPNVEALEASLLICKGDVIRGVKKLQKTLNQYDWSSINPESEKKIRSTLSEALGTVPLANNQMLALSVNRFEQPKGVKLQYWVGIGQLVAACIVAPFNPPAASALGLSGFGMTMNAVGQAMDNKDAWLRKQEENRRKYETFE